MGEETERVLAALRAWGEHPTSFQILEEGNLYWFDPEVPSPGAVVAYRECGRYRVAAGVPIAPPESTAAVAGRFISEGIAAGQRTLFFSADQDFVDALSRREGSPPVTASRSANNPSGIRLATRPRAPTARASEPSSTEPATRGSRCARGAAPRR